MIEKKLLKDGQKVWWGYFNTYDYKIHYIEEPKEYELRIDKSCGYYEICNEKSGEVVKTIYDYYYGSDISETLYETLEDLKEDWDSLKKGHIRKIELKYKRLMKDAEKLDIL